MVNIDKGYAILIREFDEVGQMISENYFGESEEPVLCSSGYHRIVRTWQDGHATSEAWFDTDGEPVAPKDTYVRVGWEYDEIGNLTVERYYGADGNPIACKGGYDENSRQYNEKG